jgi:hypothetical protein
MALKNQTRIIQQRGTKAQVEAFTASLEEGALAFATDTDTNEIGIYSNGLWEWIGGSGVVSVGELLVDDSMNILFDDNGDLVYEE